MPGKRKLIQHFVDALDEIADRIEAVGNAVDDQPDFDPTWAASSFTLRIGDDLVNGDGTAYEPSPSLAPFVGTVVQYRQKSGSQAWLPAIVTVNEDTFVSGRWEDTPRHGMTPTNNRDDYSTTRVTSFATREDADGQVWVVSEIPPIKPPILSDMGDRICDYVHLRVLSPTCNDYAEFNVLEGTEPGDWRWCE